MVPSTYPWTSCCLSPTLFPLNMSSKLEVEDAGQLLEDLRWSKTASVLEVWGREIIAAIDRNDAAKLCHSFKFKAYLGINVNETVNAHGYGGYVWTPWIHTFRGDTALHIAIKLKKLVALCTILVLDPDISIRNDEGQTPADLCLSIFKKPILEFQQDAYDYILPAMNPRDFKLLDGCLGSYVLRNIFLQAERMLYTGRQVYSEPPTDILTYYKSKGAEIESKSEIGSVNEKLGAFDVWGSLTIDDVCDQIRMQNKRFLEIQKSKRVVDNGLTLLATVNETKEPPIDVLLKMIKKPTVAALHFVKSKPGKRIIEKKIMSSKFDEEEAKKDEELFKSKKAQARFITCWSTRDNMKHMNIGTKGAEKLFRNLKSNAVVERLILPKARLNDLALSYFIDVLPSMVALKEIDLSENCITCEGAKMISAIFHSHEIDNVKILNLGYNRIRRAGLEALISIVNIMIPGFQLYITGNILPPADTELILSLIEETEGKVVSRLPRVGLIKTRTASSAEIADRSIGSDHVKSIVYGPRDPAEPLILTDKYTFPRCMYKYYYHGNF